MVQCYLTETWLLIPSDRLPVSSVKVFQIFTIGHRNGIREKLQQWCTDVMSNNRVCPTSQYGRTHILNMLCTSDFILTHFLKLKFYSSINFILMKIHYKHLFSIFMIHFRLGFWLTLQFVFTDFHFIYSYLFTKNGEIIIW